MIHNPKPLNERLRELRKKAGACLFRCANRSITCFLCRLWYAERYANKNPLTQRAFFSNPCIRLFSPGYRCTVYRRG
jgi:hypothetical protein